MTEKQIRKRWSYPELTPNARVFGTDLMVQILVEIASQLAQLNQHFAAAQPKKKEQAKP